MNQKKVRFAMVGMGALAFRHLGGVNQNSDVAETVSICDIDPDALKKRGDEFGIPEERRYTSYDKMLDDGNPVNAFQFKADMENYYTPSTKYVLD